MLTALPLCLWGGGGTNVSPSRHSGKKPSPEHISPPFSRGRFLLRVRLSGLLLQLEHSVASSRLSTTCRRFPGLSRTAGFLRPAAVRRRFAGAATSGLIIHPKGAWFWHGDDEAGKRRSSCGVKACWVKVCVSSNDTDAI